MAAHDKPVGGGSQPPLPVATHDEPLACVQDGKYNAED